MVVASAFRDYLEVHWPAIVCIAEIVFIILTSIAVIAKYERFGTRCTWSPSREEVTLGNGTSDFVSDSELWATCGGSLGPLWLLAFRVLGFLYFLPILIYEILVHGVFSYRFYTQLLPKWTFTLMVAYFMLAMCISLKGLLFTKSDQQSQTRVSLLKEEAGVSETIAESSTYILPKETNNAGCLGYVLQIFFQVTAPAVLLTDAVYWLVLIPFVIPSGFHKSFVNANVHAVNGVFMFVEFVANTMPFPWFRVGYFMLFGGSYIIFLWIMHAIGFRWWPYPFLALSTPSAPIWYFGLAVLHGICYGICLLLALAKEQVYRQCCRIWPLKRVQTISRSFSLY